MESPFTSTGIAISPPSIAKEHNRADLRLAGVDKLAAREILNQVRGRQKRTVPAKGLFLALFQTKKLLLQPFRQEVSPRRNSAGLPLLRVDSAVDPPSSFSVK